VAISVAGIVEPRLRAVEIAKADRKPTQYLDAYDLYLRALGQFHKHSLEGTLEAINLLKRALAVDPTYAPAAALVGECYVTLQVWDRVSDAQAAESVRFAKQAVEGGKNDPDTLWMAAITLSSFAGDYASARHLIERALALNPNSAHAWNAKGWVT